MEGKREFKYDVANHDRCLPLCLVAPILQETRCTPQYKLSSGLIPVISSFYQAFLTKAPVITHEALTNQIVAGARHGAGETWETTKKIDDFLS